MKLPDYSKTAAGAALILAAVLGLKFRFLAFDDAFAVFGAGLSLLGFGIRHGQEKALRKKGASRE